MCGIAGFVECALTVGQTAGLGARPRLGEMLRAVEHRGPDDWGMTFIGFPAEPRAADGDHVMWREDANARIALGHRRLSILDLSPSGRQPMRSPDGAITITFNGEIYNYIELRQELSRSTVFRTGTDTEVLLEAYRQWGIDMLGRLDGMFAFALWDAPARKLICARDPFGIKPFYYATQGGRFLFASEPRAVLAGLGCAGQMDAARVAEFLVLGVSAHDEGTSYQEVRQLPGGHWLTVDAKGSVSQPRAFWRPPEQMREAEGDVPARVREQVELAIHRQLRADVPVGSCLSGGLDSGTIVASVGRVLGARAGDFTTVTLSNREFEGDETAAAGLIAQRAGVRSVKVEPSLAQISDDLENVIRVMGEPFSGLSIFGQYKVMQQASTQGLKVMLDGQGGDEVFLGYPQMAQRTIGEYFRHGLIPSAIREWRALGRNASQPLAFSLLGNVFYGSSRLVCWRNSRRIRSAVASSLLEQVRPEVAADLYSHQSVHRLQINELTRYCLPRLLRYEDRNSMAFGLEARVPLLAIGLVETALRLPLHWRLRNGWTKYALRVAMKGRVPEEILWHRRKRGFEVPQKRWVEAARPRIAAWLADLPRESPVSGSAILAGIDAGLGGAKWFWRCLSVALWIRFSGVRA